MRTRSCTTSSRFRSGDVPARVVFNATRFVLMRILAAPPLLGISLASVVFVLAREAESQGAWKLARFAYLKLQTLKVCCTQSKIATFMMQFSMPPIHSAVS